jgi:Mn-dependent DtxR family transcriptional regulator/Fe2+ transport system protein FeoA
MPVSCAHPCARARPDSIDTHAFPSDTLGEGGMKDSDCLRIAKEDILRILAEQPGTVARLDYLKAEMGPSCASLSEAVAELEQGGLIRVVEDAVSLMPAGEHVAGDILQNHVTLEQYLRRGRDDTEAHEAAHVLEHYVSRQVVRNLGQLEALKDKGVPLTEFGFHREGMVSDISFPALSLFERVVSMGIVPGQRIEVVNRTGGTFIVNAGGKFAIDQDIARGIEVVAHEATQGASDRATERR